MQKEFFPPNRGALIYRPTRDVGKRRESSPRKKSKREKEFNPLKSSAAPAK